MKFPIAAFYPAHPSNYTPGRTSAINCITIHHSAALNDTLRYLWQNPNRNASSHFFVSDSVIEQYVDTNDTAWTNGNWASNCESVTIEVNGDWRFGYYNQATLDNLQRLLVELRKVYPATRLTYHKDVSQIPTACPADLKDKGYAQNVWNNVNNILNPPTPPAPAISYEAITLKKVILNKTTNLWNFNFTNWADAKAIQAFQKGVVIDVVAVAKNALGAKYYMTAFSYNEGKIRATNGFNIADCDNFVEPIPPKPEPLKPEPPKPEPTPDPEKPSIVDVEKRLTVLENIVKALQATVDKLVAWAKSFNK